MARPPGSAGHGGGEARAPTLPRLLGWENREQPHLLGAVSFRSNAPRFCADAAHYLSAAFVRRATK